MMKAGGNTARQMARSAWDVDFVKMVRLSSGPAIFALCWERLSVDDV